MSLPPSYDNYPRRVVRHTIQYSDPGPTHDSERVRSDDERLRKVEERLEREVRRDEYERRDRERMLAINERAKFHEQMDRLERDRVRTIMEDERIRQEREERIRRAQARSQRDQELLRREQEHAEDLIEKQRAEKLYEQNRKELELTEELYRTQRMEQDLERRKLSRKERRTNSGKTSSESRPAKVERVQSSGLSAPPPDEPKSFLSRFSGFLASAPAGKTEATPSKTEQAPKIDTSTKIDTVAKTVAKPDKSEPQLRSALTDLEGYFLQPAQDSLIQKSVVALSDSIDQHVYNHYGDRAASPSHDAFLRIVQLDAENLRLPQILTIKSSFRLAAIRRMIASALIRNISAKGDPSTTFMPKEVVSLLAMAPTRGTERFQFGASSVLRRTAANLLQLGQNTESSEYTEFKNQQVKIASDRLHRHLSIIANLESSDAARREQLEAIMNKGAQIGVLLLLQPATYEFDWNARFAIGSSVDDQEKGSSRPGPFVIFPALSKTGDSKGRELRKPQIVCKPEYLDEDDLAENGIM